VAMLLELALIAGKYVKRKLIYANPTAMFVSSKGSTVLCLFEYHLGHVMRGPRTELH